jgi:hypothetical protein
VPVAATAVPAVRLSTVLRKNTTSFRDHPNPPTTMSTTMFVQFFLLLA